MRITNVEYRRAQWDKASTMPASAFAGPIELNQIYVDLVMDPVFLKAAIIWLDGAQARVDNPSLFKKLNDDQLDQLKEQLIPYQYLTLVSPDPMQVPKPVTSAPAQGNETSTPAPVPAAVPTAHV